MTCNLWVILASDILLSAHPMLYPEKSMVNMMESSLTETMVSNTGNMYDPMVSTLLRYYTKHATASSDHNSSCILLLCSQIYFLILAGYLHSLQLKFSYHLAFIHLFKKSLFSCQQALVYWSDHAVPSNTRTLALYARPVQKCASAFRTKSSHCFSHFYAYWRMSFE